MKNSDFNITTRRGVKFVKWTGLAWRRTVVKIATKELRKQLV